MIDGFLVRHKMAPSRLGRDVLGEPQFVSEVRKGRVPSLPTLTKLAEFIRSTDASVEERSDMATDRKAVPMPLHRQNAGAR